MALILPPLCFLYYYNVNPTDQSSIRPDCCCDYRSHIPTDNNPSQLLSHVGILDQAFSDWSLIIGGGIKNVYRCFARINKMFKKKKKKMNRRKGCGKGSSHTNYEG